MLRVFFYKTHIILKNKIILLILILVLRKVFTHKTKTTAIYP